MTTLDLCPHGLRFPMLECESCQLRVAEALCRRALTHLNGCSDTWTPHDPLVNDLRKFLNVP